MLRTSSAPSLRLKGISIIHDNFKAIPPADQLAVLWGVLDLCAEPAEQRAHVHLGTGNVPAALAIIRVNFSLVERVFASIIGPLVTDYPILARSLKALTIVNSYHDESSALVAFAALATDLWELTFRSCSLTSVRALEGRCEHLRILNVSSNQLESLDGLEHHLHLEEVNASYTALTCVEPLCHCPALTKVYLLHCPKLSSIRGLEGHQHLELVNLSSSPVTSLVPLRSCPALTKVHLSKCPKLFSIEGLDDHLNLQELLASHTPITSVEPLRSCPALTWVNLDGCKQLSSLQGLEHHLFLRNVSASETAIASVEPLRTCPALNWVKLISCVRLPARLNLPSSVTVNCRKR